MELRRASHGLLHRDLFPFSARLMKWMENQTQTRLPRPKLSFPFHGLETQLEQPDTLNTKWEGNQIQTQLTRSELSFPFMVLKPNLNNRYPECKGLRDIKSKLNLPNLCWVSPFMDLKPHLNNPITGIQSESGNQIQTQLTRSKLSFPFHGLEATLTTPHPESKWVGKSNPNSTSPTKVEFPLSCSWNPIWSTPYPQYKLSREIQSKLNFPDLSWVSLVMVLNQIWMTRYHEYKVSREIKSKLNLPHLSWPNKTL